MDADDLVQETHVAVFQHIRSFIPRGPDSFDRWVTVIAVGRLRDAIKRFKAAKRGGGQIAKPARPSDLQSSMVALLDLIAGPGRTPSRTMAGVEAQQASGGAQRPAAASSAGYLAGSPPGLDRCGRSRGDRPNRARDPRPVPVRDHGAGNAIGRRFTVLQYGLLRPPRTPFPPL